MRIIVVFFIIVGFVGKETYVLCEYSVNFSQNPFVYTVFDLSITVRRGRTEWYLNGLEANGAVGRSVAIEERHIITSGLSIEVQKTRYCLEFRSRNTCEECTQLHICQER